MTDPDRYRREVQTRVEEFLTKPQEQSTRETALEAVFELIKLYIYFKEEKAKESKHRSRKCKMNDDPQKHRRRRRVNYERLDGEEHDHSHQRHHGKHHHRDRSPSRSRSPHTSDRRSKHSPHSEPNKPYKLTEELLDKFNDQQPKHSPHSEKNERHNSTKELPDNLNNQQPKHHPHIEKNKPYKLTKELLDKFNKQQSNSPDPMTDEGFINHEPQYMMTGGAGPPSSPRSLPINNQNPPQKLKGILRNPYPRTPSPLLLRPPSPKAERKHHRHHRAGHTSSRPPPSPRPRSALPRHVSPSAGRQAGIKSRSSTRGHEKAHGDSPSKFGDEKSSTTGFVNRFMGLYREIKAEHEAGIRSKGVVERKLDDVRRKRREERGEQ